jgi:hypothetical protein
VTASQGCQVPPLPSPYLADGNGRYTGSVVALGTLWRLIEEIRFARDSPLEECGFELSVPRAISRDGNPLAADRHPISNGMASLSASSSGGDHHSKLDEVTRSDLDRVMGAKSFGRKTGIAGDPARMAARRVGSVRPSRVSHSRSASPDLLPSALRAG